MSDQGFGINNKSIRVINHGIVQELPALNLTALLSSRLLALKVS